MADRFAALDGTRRALFEALTRRKTDDAPPPDGPVPASGDDRPVLSFAQRRLWFVDQLHPGSPAYNVPIAIRMRGRLDVDALADALADVVARHRVLTTVYVPDGDEPTLRHVDCWRPDLPIHDVADDDALVALLQREGARPFALDVEPPLRACLVRLDDDHHVLLVTVHHIVTDGWSTRTMFGEIAEYYSARVEGRDPNLPDLPVQYADYARWERERISGERLDDLVTYWRDQIGTAEAVDLPTDRPRPPVFDHAGRASFVDLPADVAERVRAFGSENGATLYMTLLAAFVTTLSRYTGQQDLIVGGSVAGRQHESVRDLVGFFVNTVALRLRLDDDPTFRELVQRARSATLGAHSHQEMPFDLLVDELGIRRDPSRHPLTPVMFLLDETPDTGPPMAGLDVDIVDFGMPVAKFDLMVNIHDTGTQIRALVEYSAALFDDATIKRLIAHFVALLDSATADPDCPVTALPILTAEERARVVDDWNATERDLDTSRCLHQLFEAHVDTSPDDPALLCAAIGSGWEITYAELDRRANRLAHHLVAHGAGRDRLVALCLRRGPDLVVAILAVLKSGAAFVPLDPEYPPVRLQTMLTDSGASLVVTDSTIVERLGDTSAPVIHLDRDRRDILACSSERPKTAVDVRNLAYVIYTSGSTGEPKGIALEHRGVVNNLLDLNTSYDIGPGDAVLSLSSPSFDMSVYETLGMLAAGGTTILPDPSAARDPAHWVDLAQRFDVSVWNSAPALLDLFLDEIEHRGGVSLPSLRVAFLGGDWIGLHQPGRLRAAAGDLRFVALGGATEASIHSIVHDVDHVDPEWRHIPYGRPMANQRAYVLDDHGQLTPFGVPGELHLGGIGLARGYLDRPDLTRTKFVTVQIAPGRVERLYRTGDVAVQRADGVIDLLGRMDFRIKLNGLRIEPGEIEQAIRACDGVDDAVVVARDSGGRRQLVGYLVADHDVDLAAVKQRLAATLPTHSVPATLHRIVSLPLTPNGKVDRAALTANPPAVAPAPAPAPATPASAPTRAPVPAPAAAAPAPPAPASGTPAAPASAAAPTPAPATPAAQPAVVDVTDDALLGRVLDVWRDVLDDPAAGPDDDFFDLGGDSFAAVQAIRRIDPDVRVLELFQHPTPRRLAARLTELAVHGRPATHRLLQPLGQSTSSSMPLVCFPHGGGDAIAYQRLADALPDMFALVAVSPPGHDPAQPGPMLPYHELARRCADEIARTIDGPFAVYGHCAGVVPALETTRLLEQDGHAPSRLILGGALPEDDPQWSLEMERTVSDDDLASYLRSIGGFDGVLDEQALSSVLRMVRHDMTEAARFFGRFPDGYPTPLRTRLTCVFGDADSATEGFEHRYRAWERYIADVDTRVVANGGHYFVKHLPDALADLLVYLLRPTASAVRLEERP